MHFTENSHSKLGPGIVYYTKLKLSRIYNHFVQTTDPGLLEIRRFKGFLLSPFIPPFPLNSLLPSQTIYVESLQKSFRTQFILYLF